MPCQLVTCILLCNNVFVKGRPYLCTALAAISPLTDGGWRSKRLNLQKINHKYLKCLVIEDKQKHLIQTFHSGTMCQAARRRDSWCCYWKLSALPSALQTQIRMLKSSLKNMFLQAYDTTIIVKNIFFSSKIDYIFRERQKHFYANRP